MSSPAPPGGPSPLRVGGLALLGVGVVAGLIGLGTMFTNGGFGGPNTAAPSAAAPTSVPGTSESAAPTSSAEVPVPSFGATPPNGIAAPPTTAPAAPDGYGSGAASGRSGGGTAVVRAPLRVYNNSRIPGLAERAAQDFRDAGWPVEQVANYPSGIIPTSTVYYRPGTGEQAAAEALGSEFGLRVRARFEGLNDASPGLIVIVTSDYQQRG